MERPAVQAAIKAAEEDIKAGRLFESDRKTKTFSPYRQ